MSSDSEEPEEINFQAAHKQEKEFKRILSKSRVVPTKKKRNIVAQKKNEQVKRPPRSVDEALFRDISEQLPEAEIQKIRGAFQISASTPANNKQNLTFSQHKQLPTTSPNLNRKKIINNFTIVLQQKINKGQALAAAHPVSKEALQYRKNILIEAFKDKRAPLRKIISKRGRK